MSASDFIDLQEALFWFFAPVLQNLPWLFLAGCIFSAIGVVILEVANRLTR